MPRPRQTERYIPANLTEEIKHQNALPGEKLPAAVYVDRAKLSAMGFAGRSVRRAFYHRFINAAQMESHIADFLKREAEREKYLADRAAEKKQPHTLSVGAIVYNSWGWEQTNIDYFEVTKATARFVTLRPLCSTMTKTSGDMAGLFAPCPGQYLSETETRHSVSMYKGSPSIKFRHGGGSVYDGTPKRASWDA